MVTSRVCTACKQEKPLPEFYKHPVGPYGRACKCIPCSKQVNSAAYNKNRSKRLASMSAYRSDNLARIREQKRVPHIPELYVPKGWRTQSQEYKRIRDRLSYETDERYKVANLVKAARRRACQAPWADEDKIQAIYAEARRLTVETGIEHHVDHIIPIKGDIVCGLHVETNLRIVPAAENLRKKNKFCSAAA